jgi:hypothetical protein
MQSSGAISLLDLEGEFGGSGPISLSEYYRSLANYDRVVSGNNISVPQAGAISFSNFYNSALKRYVEVTAIGGGGAGGFGNEDGGEEYRGTYGGFGGTTTVTGTGVSVTAAGGQGGENAGLPRGSVGGDGQGTIYGAGGTGGARNSDAPAVPTDHYGAGGGGGGGDSGSTYDAGGCAGIGGNAGTYIADTFWVVPNTTLTITVGDAGVYVDSTYDGANGVKGYAVVTSNGVTKAATSSNATVTV